MATTEKEEKPKKKKTLGLTARQSFKRQRQMQGYRNDRNTVLGLITAVLTVGIVWFVLAGGINQKAFFDECGRIANNIGNWFAERFGVDDIDVTDQGIYIKGQAPEGAESLGSENSENNND